MKSIYHDEPIIPVDLQDRIARFDSELRDTERLIAMGYNYSGSVDLQARAKWLRRAITDLERQIEWEARNKKNQGKLIHRLLTMVQA